MNIKKIILVCCIMHGSSVYAQLSNAFPAFYREYYTHTSTLNPAAFDDSTTFHGTLHYKSYPGPLSILKTFLGSAEYRINASNGVGIQFQSEQEGEYFDRNRLYFLYHTRVQLNRHTTLRAGVYAGYLNYSFGASSASPGGSSGAFDVTVGLNCNYKRLTVGVSGHHLPGIQVQPVDFQFELPRYGELFASYDLRLSPYLTYTPHVRTRYAPGTGQLLFLHTHLIRQARQRWSVGAHHLVGVGIAPVGSVGVPLKVKTDSLLRISFSFLLGTEHSAITNQFANQYEIGMGVLW